jgi:hypothetical protein
MRPAWLVSVLAGVLSCNGTTGFDLVEFYAAGRGFSDAAVGQPYTFTTAAGVPVTLTRATLHVGALYLTQSVPQAGGGPQPCTLPQTFEGAFVGEVRGEADIDLLNPAPQQIPVIGEGSTIPAATGQVWLLHDSAITQGTLNGSDNDAGDPILGLEGRFEDATGVHTFSAAITIDATRISAQPNSALPGEVQICQQRIVSGIPVQLTLAQSGTLVVEVDAKPLFNGVPFTDLPPAASAGSMSACLPGAAPERCFTNDDSNVSSTVLFSNLKTTGPYRFGWLAPAP